MPEISGRRNKGMATWKDHEWAMALVEEAMRHQMAGDLDEAIPWLEKAKTARRYEPRHFPYLNLGHIYAAKGMLNKAPEEFRGALKFNPGDALALRAIEELESKLQ